MGKLVDIKNGQQEKAFELHKEQDALCLHVKCSDNKRRHKIVEIKVNNVLYQIATATGTQG